MTNTITELVYGVEQRIADVPAEIRTAAKEAQADLPLEKANGIAAQMQQIEAGCYEIEQLVVALRLLRGLETSKPPGQPGKEKA